MKKYTAIIGMMALGATCSFGAVIEIYSGLEFLGNPDDLSWDGASNVTFTVTIDSTSAASVSAVTDQGGVAVVGLDVISGTFASSLVGDSFTVNWKAMTGVNSAGIGTDDAFVQIEANSRIGVADNRIDAGEGIAYSIDATGLDASGQVRLFGAQAFLLNAGETGRVVQAGVAANAVAFTNLDGNDDRPDLTGLGIAVDGGTDGGHVATYMADAGASFNARSLQLEVVPEPATLGLITALGGVVIFIRRRFMI